MTTTSVACIAGFLALFMPAAVWAQGGNDHVATIALAPFETLGAESKVSRNTQALVAEALARVQGHSLIDARKVRRALRKKPRLRACAGAATCLSGLGENVGATYVVFGEVGGLGAAEVIYLELIDVGLRRSIRSTTLEVGGGDPEKAAHGAAVQLLTPDKYVGSLEANVDTENASIYVDGQRLARSPASPIPLSVGSHAVRITHPEFRDYVRFVDISFDQTTTIDANLQEFPIVATDLAQDPNAVGNKKRPGGNRRIIYKGQEPTPWYRKWYTVAGVGTAALIGSAIVVGVLVNGIDADDEKVVEPPQ